MNTLNACVKHSSETASRVVDGEAVVVLPMQSAINTLNEVGTRIWELADGTRTVSDIARAIAQEYEVDMQTAAQDTRDFVDEMVAKNMLIITAS